MFCSSCGVKNQDGASSCSSCGVSFENSGFNPDKAKEHVTKTANDAWIALKSLGLDPVGGLLQTYQSLGSVRALSVSFAFGLVFASCFAFVAYQIPQLGFIPSIRGLSGFFKIMIIGLTPFLSMSAACLIGSKVTNGKGDLASNFFISGVSLLPLSIFLLISATIGIKNIEVSFVLFTIAVCMTVMILFNGLTRIGQLSDKATSYAVPLIILISGWIAKIFLTSIF